MDHKDRLRHSYMVMQDVNYELFADSVESECTFGIRNPKQTLVDATLEELALAPFRDRHPNTLSGGQKQRVAIAGAIAMLPQCIIFDESTAMLDPNGRREVLEVIEKLNREEHITIILITHFMDEAARADRILVLDHGELKLDGTPREGFSHVDQLYEMGLDVPQSTRLLDSLKKEGAPVTRTVIFAEEAVDEIEKMIESKRKNQ